MIFLLFENINFIVRPDQSHDTVEANFLKMFPLCAAPAGRTEHSTPPSPCASLTLSYHCELLSKNQLERKLHGTRPAHLIEGTQDAQRLRERGCRLAEGRLADARIDGSEIGVIENIESLSPEL